MTTKKTSRQSTSVLAAAQLQPGSVISPVTANVSVVDGKVDLEGLTVSSVTRTVVGVTFEDVNLTSARMRDLWVEGCHFLRTSFAAADLSGWADHGNTFVECVFDGASLSKASLGHRGSRYVRCRFHRVNLLRTTFARAEFDECEFADCKLKDVDFFASSFDRCSFEGRLEDVWFRGGYPPPAETFEQQFGRARPNRMRDVDFSRASLFGVTFSDNCDLSSCRLPLDQYVVRFANWPATVSLAHELAADVFSVEDILEVRNLLRAYGSDPTQAWYIVNFGDVAEAVNGDAGFADRFRLLLMKANKNVSAKGNEA